MRASIDTLLAVVSHGSRDAQRYAVMAISNMAATDRTREMLKEKGAEAILRKCAQANSGDQMLTSVSINHKPSTLNPALNTTLNLQPSTLNKMLIWSPSPFPLPSLSASRRPVLPPCGVTGLVSVHAGEGGKGRAPVTRSNTCASGYVTEHMICGCHCMGGEQGTDNC